MAHFIANNNEVKKGTTWESQPVQTDFAEFITGSFFSEQGGTLEIQQTFEYPKNHENDEKALEGVHWDIVTQVTVAAKEGKGFQIFALAPYFRLVYKNSSGVDDKAVRAYARAQEKGRV